MRPVLQEELRMTQKTPVTLGAPLRGGVFIAWRGGGDSFVACLNHLTIDDVCIPVETEHRSYS